MNRVIVSRHRATIEWIARQLETEGLQAHVLMGPGAYHTPMVVLRTRADVDSSFGDPRAPAVEIIPIILGDATPDDVRSRIVYGNLPYRLAMHAAVVYAVEFRGQLPRGADYGLKEMEAAGIHLAAYSVVTPVERSGLTAALKILDDHKLLNAGLGGDSSAMQALVAALREAWMESRSDRPIG